MATYTFTITRTGFQKTVRVYKDGVKIYTGPPSSTTPQETLVREAILALEDNVGPEVRNMTQVYVSENTPPDTPPPPPPTPPPPPPQRPTPKPPKPTGKGLERITGNIARQLGNLQKSVDDIYYGSKTKNTGIKLPGGKSRVNGVLPIVEEISKYDLCNILTYVTSNTNLQTITGQNTVVGRKFTELQAKAKNLAIEIDSKSLSATSLKDSTRVGKIATSIRDLIKNIDADTVTVMPQLANAKNYLEDIQGTLSGFSTSGPGPNTQFQNLNTIPNAQVQKVLNKIRGIQSTLYAIANMKSVQDVLNLANNAGRLNVANQLKQLQQLVDPARLLPAFRQIAGTLNSINQSY